MDEGRVIERGTHDELLNLGEVYAAMWQRQVMEGEDFASQVIEFPGAKRDPEPTDLPAEHNWRFAPKV
jgi:hypothetical protein